MLSYVVDRVGVGGGGSGQPNQKNPGYATGTNQLRWGAKCIGSETESGQGKMTYNFSVILGTGH